MWRLLVALSALLALALAGPVMVSAQEATPAAGPGATDVIRTDVRYLLPFGPDGLNPGLTVSATVEGVCGFSSIVALDRPDAWDCISADNEIFDPCFEPFMQDPEELGQLACVEAPFATEVTLLTLTEPLVREKEAADPGADPSMGMGQRLPTTPSAVGSALGAGAGQRRPLHAAARDAHRDGRPDRALWLRRGRHGARARPTAASRSGRSATWPRGRSPPASSR